MSEPTLTGSLVASHLRENPGGVVGLRSQSSTPLLHSDSGAEGPQFLDYSSSPDYRVAQSLCPQDGHVPSAAGTSYTGMPSLFRVPSSPVQRPFAPRYPIWCSGVVTSWNSNCDPHFTRVHFGLDHSNLLPYSAAERERQRW